MSPTPGTPCPDDRTPAAPPAAPQQVAIWYFLGATLVFASPVWFGWDIPLWARIVLLTAGFGLLLIGCFQLAREVEARRKAKAAAAPARRLEDGTDQ